MPSPVLSDSTPAPEPAILRLPRGRALPLGDAPLVMGVLNVTPDSFSDGGHFDDTERALEHAFAMVEAGADLLDLGAESTRPGGGVYGAGARTVPVREEVERLLPVLETLRSATDLPISVDTRKGAVAAACLAVGADLVNDVSALADPAMGEAVAAAGCPVVLMHSRGELASMQRGIRFRDLLSEVRAELGERIAVAEGHGIAPEQILVDPGIGFGKRAEHNLELIRRLEELRDLDRPLVVGASRKSFIAAVRASAPVDRLGGSLAAAAWAVRARAEIVRVHDVGETRQFLDVWKAIEETGGGA